LLLSFSTGKVSQERIHWFVIIEGKIEEVTGKDFFENSSKAQAVHQKWTAVFVYSTTALLTVT